MVKKLRIAMVTPELAPYARSGELAEAVAGLTRFLARAGLEVSVFLPHYRRPELDSLSKEVVQEDLQIPVGGKKFPATVYRAEPGRFTLYLIDQPKYFHRDYIYGSPQGDYPDNAERFIFFNRAVCEFLASSRLKFELLHCHNWPASLVPMLLRSLYQKKPALKKTACVLTIHNFSYQGEFPAESLSLTGLDWNYLNSHQLAFRGKFSFLKAGILFSEVINTVSRTYRDEVLHNHRDLCSFFSRKSKPLYSLRNGIDDEEWNPATDPLLPANFDPDHPEGKSVCKRHLQKECQLPVEDNKPLVAVAGYLTRLKGLDLVIEAAGSLVGAGCQLVVAGQGEERYEQALSELQQVYKGKLAFKPEFSAGLYHQLLAAADLLLMPSLEEPCGLTLMHGLRYGTVPVVRATGGLRESVQPFSGESGQGNGFIFEDFQTEALLQAVQQALQVYASPQLWSQVRANCLATDNSWSKMIRKYRLLYQKAIILNRGGNI
ncbi:MAG: glycogen synthase [Candidatus Saccharicenans sp.]|uniref:glycogen synthase n=1 Tax=Candidatus Saccharicenans sp. TaxID=2819258 RepID=UPI00404B2100